MYRSGTLSRPSCRIVLPTVRRVNLVSGGRETQQGRRGWKRLTADGAGSGASLPGWQRTDDPPRPRAGPPAGHGTQPTRHRAPPRSRARSATDTACVGSRQQPPPLRAGTAGVLGRSGAINARAALIAKLDRCTRSVADLAAPGAQAAGPRHRRGSSLRVPVHRRPPGMAPGRAGDARSDHRRPRRRPLMGEGCRQAERHRAPHPHRRPVDAPGRPPGPPGARTRAPRRRTTHQQRRRAHVSGAPGAVPPPASAQRQAPPRARTVARACQYSSRCRTATTSPPPLSATR